MISRINSLECNHWIKHSFLRPLIYAAKLPWETSYEGISSQVRWRLLKSVHAIAELCKLHAQTLCLCPSKFHFCCYLPIITPTKFRLFFFLNLWEISGRMSNYWCCGTHYLITSKMGHFSSWLVSMPPSWVTFPTLCRIGIRALPVSSKGCFVHCVSSSRQVTTSSWWDRRPPFPGPQEPDWLIHHYSPPSSAPSHGLPGKPTVERPLFSRLRTECFILVTPCNSHNQPMTQDLLILTIYVGTNWATEF